MSLEWEQRKQEVNFERITTDPDQMAGMPCVRGLRIPVATIVGMVAHGMTHAETLAALPDLTAEDIVESLHFAAAAVREGGLPPRGRGDPFHK